MRVFGLSLGICLLAILPAMAAEPFGFAAMGDMPYGKSADDGRYEALIETINNRKPAFTIHIGDFKPGNASCSDQAFQATLDTFSKFDSPLIYTPGDNEWTDCHRFLAGGFDPIERLEKLRAFFFSDGQSLGQSQVPLERQSIHGGVFVEHATWSHDAVRFATLHVVGSGNNFNPGDPAAMREFLAREAAVADWIDHVRSQAIEEGAAAMVLAFHGDFLVGRDDSDEQDIEAGFQTLADGLIDLAEGFDRPILIIHGDWHDFTFDQPLRDHQGNILENIWRLRVPGAKDIRAVWVTYDRDAKVPFSALPFGAEASAGKN